MLRSADYENGLGKLLKVRDLEVSYRVRGSDKFFSRRRVNVLRKINLELDVGQTIGIVGESGCGKSTLGRAIARLVPLRSGAIYWEGDDVSRMTRRKLREYRCDVQLIFQDALGSLNPKKRIRSILREAVLVNKVTSRSEVDDYVKGLFESVGLNTEDLSKYPHQFSGGQQQRIAIARAFSVRPRLVICDESVSALDLSVQAKILNLLRDLQEERSTSYIFISHDLSVIQYISDVIIVMYLGEVVEKGTRDQIMGRPRHPYTRALLSSSPQELGGGDRKKFITNGMMESVMKIPGGCPYHTRCYAAKVGERLGVCSKNEPELYECEPGHWVRCHFADDIISDWV